MFLNTSTNKTETFNCKDININENYFFKNSLKIELFFKEKINDNINFEAQYSNLNFNAFLINIFILKILKLKSFKNFKYLLDTLFFSLEDLNFFVKFLNEELIQLNSNLNYKSNFILKLDLNLNSLFFLIFVNNQSETQEYLELNVFSTFCIKNLNYFLKNIRKELFLKKDTQHILWYFLLNISSISYMLEENFLDKNYANIFFQYFIEKKSFEDAQNFLQKCFDNINLITKNKQQYLKINKKNILKENSLLIEGDSSNEDDSSNEELQKSITTEDTHMLFLLKNLFSKKYNNFLKNNCSQKIVFLNDISFFLTNLTLFYESKLIVEFGIKYWSNSALNFLLLKENLYKKILINTKNLDLEIDFDENMLTKIFFINKSFHIKKNKYSMFNSKFDLNKLIALNNKINKVAFYINEGVFFYLFDFFENFILNISLADLQKKNLNIKDCILSFEHELEKINNFNFFNIETTIIEQEEKYKIFISLFFIYTWTYKDYAEQNALKKEFLNFFFKETEIKELTNCIQNELNSLDALLKKNLNFEVFSQIIKTIKNITLFLVNTLEISIKDVSNNNYNSAYFLKINYCEYILFTAKFKKLISYSEQIITIYNLKKKIEVISLNKKKLFGIEIKLDFRGRVYTLNPVKAYDNNKLIRQSIQIKNTIKVSKLFNWYVKLYKKININNILDLNEEVYSFILNKKEFKSYTFLLNANLLTLKKKEFIKFLYLKAKTASLMYLGFLLLSSEEKKTYNMITILEKGFLFFYSKNLNEQIEKKKKELNLELYVEFVQVLDSLNNLNKKSSFNNLLLNSKLLSLDSSCNGYTHLLYTLSEFNETEFQKFKEVLNLSNSNKNFDFYSEVLEDIRKKNKILEEGVNNKIITRNSIKKIIMTIPYNAKEFGFIQKLKQDIIEKDTKKKNLIIKELILFFSKDFKNKIINKTFITKLKEFLKNKKIKNLYYVIDNNTKINLTYFKEKNEKIPYIDNILNKKKSVYIKVLTSKLNTEKIVTASVANIIHANDAFCIRELILNSELNILTIHDCVKFNAFLFEEILFSYELIFKDFYKNYNIYDKLYYEDYKTKKLKKMFENNNTKKPYFNATFEKSKYILKF